MDLNDNTPGPAEQIVDKVCDLEQTISEGNEEISSKLEAIDEEIRRGNLEVESILLILEGGFIAGAIALGLWSSARAVALGIILGCFAGFFYSRSSIYRRRR